MSFRLSKRSLSFCRDVDPLLVSMDVYALRISTQDWGHTEGQSRTDAEQAVKVAQGFSKTMKSDHIIDPATGWSKALDCVPWDGKAYVWDWDRIWPIAVAWRRASLTFNVPIIWGGVFDTPLASLSIVTPAQAKIEHEAYIARVKARGVARPLMDGPHMALA